MFSEIMAPAITGRGSGTVLTSLEAYQHGLRLPSKNYPSYEINTINYGVTDGLPMVSWLEIFGNLGVILRAWLGKCWNFSSGVAYQQSAAVIYWYN